MRSYPKVFAIVQLLSILTVIGLATPSALEELGEFGSNRARPIHISFAHPNPPKAISQGEVYHVQVLWRNRVTSRSYEGCFVFTVKGLNFTVSSDDITLTFEGSTITPQESDDSLTYHLPPQTFPAGESGIISVEVIHNKPGKYLWRIGITEMSH